MALRAVISSKLPMVIVLGATGTGKTKLGVELAQKFNGEIISADSMQTYKGLDVVTAKANRQERDAVPHHLLDILEPNQMFTVVDFRNRALKLIDNLIEKDKMPTVVGGTVYYIESVVFKILVEPMDSDEALLWDVSRRKRGLDNPDHESAKKKQATGANIDAATTNVESTKAQEELSESSSKDTSETDLSKENVQEFYDNEEEFTNEEVHEKLKAIDPVMAARLHPNNRRKILRSIEVWLKSGRLHSDILAEQRLVEGELRRPGSTIVFWLKCDQEVHDERLNARVDSMLEQGLIAELLDFHERHNRQRIQDGKPPDYTKGVFQTLGFKEFHDYLMLTPEERDTDKGKKLLKESIENMKLGTRRYARRQNKMVQGRFLEHPTREIPPIYVLDTTDVLKWEENVKNKAIHVIESHINNLTCDYEPLKSIIPEVKRLYDAHSYNFCDVCSRIFVGDHIYAIHLESNRHKKVLKMKSQKANKNEKKLDC